MLGPVPLAHELPSTRYLPSELQRELNLPRWDLQSSELTKATYRLSIPVEGLKVVKRWREVGVVENIEELRSELDIEVFRNFGNFSVLNHGEIHIEQPWPYDGVAPQVTKQVEAAKRWQSLTLRSDSRSVLSDWRRWIAVGVEEGLVGCLGIDEAGWIDVLEAAATP